jgi:outer membrane protein
VTTAFLFFLAAASATEDASARLTAAEVAQRAAATSPQVKARADEARAAAAAVDQALAAYVPRVSTSLSYTRLSNTTGDALGSIVVAPGAAPGPLAANTPLAAVPLRFDVPVNQYVAGASILVPLSDYLLRFPQLTAAARANARAATLLEHASRLRVATDAQGIYYGWVRAQMQLDITRQSLAQARAHLADVITAQEAGSASLADRLRVEAQVAQAELLVTRSETLVTVLDRQLRIVMHDDSGRVYQIGEVPEGDGAEQSEAALVSEALGRRLELRALLESESALRSQATAARRAGLPRLDGVANTVYARPNQRVFPQKDEFRGAWDAGLVLSWAPTDMFGTEAASRGVRARADATAAERQGVADGIRLEVTQALQSLREAQAALGTSARAVRAAEESYRVRRLLFQNGRATSVELTDAETELLRAKLEAVFARVDGRAARVRLDHAVGRDVTSF